MKAKIRDYIEIIDNVIYITTNDLDIALKIFDKAKKYAKPHEKCMLNNSNNSKYKYMIEFTENDIYIREANTIRDYINLVDWIN